MQPNDLEVFLTFYGPSEEAPNTTATRTEGYLVSAVSESNDGSGVLVLGDAVDGHPREYMTEQLFKKLAVLELTDGEFFEDFHLHALGTYVRQRLRFKQ